MRALTNWTSGVEPATFRWRALPVPRQRPGRRFERLMNKAPGFAGGYLLVRPKQMIHLNAHYLFGFASTFPNITDRSVWVEPLAV